MSTGSQGNSGDFGGFYDSQIVAWRHDHALPQHQHVLDLSQELAAAMQKREHELGGPVVSIMGDGERIFDQKWRRLRDLHDALLGEWRDGNGRFPFVCHKVDEMSRRLDIDLEMQGVARAVVEQSLRTFRHQVLTEGE